ncbi:MAG: hypothetical protein K2P99_02520, partial [Burkholderiales bacterium]|nr:hypothetical protein [Burkholderiales bacterium]
MINYLPYCLDICTNVSLILCIVFSVKFFYKLSLLLRIVVSIIVISASILVPIVMQTNILWIMRGALSDLSINSMLILLILATNKVFGVCIPRIKYSYALLIFIIGVMLYLSVFGVINFSIYNLGFTPNWSFFLGLYFIVLLIWQLNRFYAWVLFISLVAFYYKLQNSINLWDYIID